jgi:myo-inositol-1-phosphate synthase
MQGIHEKPIRVAIAGVGNCASSLIEGLAFYCQNAENNQGLLFPELCGYSVRDIEVVAAFDISARKVGRSIAEAIVQAPNNFTRIPGVQVTNLVIVRRGPTLDGNPPHLAEFVPESDEPEANVMEVLEESRAQVLVNLLPTGSIQATEFYAKAALEAGCALINCIPTVLAQKPDIEEQFSRKGLPVFGDDIKSQLGTTILHRTLLKMLRLRGAHLEKTSQVNIGGNTDFANFVYRAETKLVSKRKSLSEYTNGTPMHVGHHYDITKGALKHAFIEIEASVFGGSTVKISIKLESDDKPNSAGSVVDLIRLARAALDQKRGGVIPEVCAFYFKSPPMLIEESEALALIEQNWNRQIVADFQK